MIDFTPKQIAGLLFLFAWPLGMKFIQKRHSQKHKAYKNGYKTGTTSLKGYTYMVIYTIIIFTIGYFLAKS